MGCNSSKETKYVAKSRIIEADKPGENKHLGESQLQELQQQIPKFFYHLRDNNSIVWVSKGRIEELDMKTLFQVYRKTGRRLHINTGVHGDFEGQMEGNVDFFIEDLESIKKDKLFSIHTSSKQSPAIYPENVDVVNAWCFSEVFYLKNQSELKKAEVDQQSQSNNDQKKQLLKDLTYYKAEIEQNPLESSLYYELIEIYKKLGYNQEILVVYELMIKNGIESYDTFSNRLQYLEENYPKSQQKQKLEAAIDLNYHHENTEDFDERIKQYISEAGGREKLTQQYQQAIANNQNKQKNWIYKGEINLIFNDFKGAVVCFQNSQKVKFSQVIEKQIAECLYKSENYVDTIKICENLIENNPDNILALKMKARSLLELKQYEQAIQEYDKVIKIDPSDKIAQSEREITIKKLQENSVKYNKTQDAKVFYEKGSALDDLKQYKEAIECYDKAIKLDPQYSDAYHNKGLTLYNQQQYKEANEYYDKAIEINPQYAYAHNNKGLALFQLNQFKEAIECFSQAIQVNPEYFEAFFSKGLSLKNLNQFNEAIDCYDKAIQINPQFTGAYNRKGLLLDDLEQYKEAIECFDKVIQIDPEYYDAYHNKGLTLCNQQQYKEAIEYYDKAIEINPSYEFFHNKGLTLYNLKQHSEAIECFDKAIEINPQFAVAYFIKGNTLDDLKQYNEAIECFDKVIQIDPEYYDAYINRERVKIKLKNSQEQ